MLHHSFPPASCTASYDLAYQRIYHSVSVSNPLNLFLTTCRNFYKTGISQLLQRFNLRYPLYELTDEFNTLDARGPTFSQKANGKHWIKLKFIFFIIGVCNRLPISPTIFRRDSVQPRSHDKEHGRKVAISYQ